MAVDKLFDLGTQHEILDGASFPPTPWFGKFYTAIRSTIGYAEFDLEQLLKDHHADLSTALEATDETTNQPFIDALNVGDGNLFDWRKVSRNDSYSYYYIDHEKAKVLKRLLDIEEPKDKTTFRGGWPINTVWRIEASLDDVIFESDESRENFRRDELQWEIPIKALAKNSPNGFKWHLLTLPSIVAAYAALQGWDVPSYDLSEFMVPEDDFIITPKTQLRLIGDRAVGYTNAALGTRRRALWAALGEDNFKVSGPSKTESKQLKEALTVANSDWAKPVWIQMARVLSPFVGDRWEFGDDAGQNKVPVVLCFYRDKKEAEKAFREDRASRTAFLEEGQSVTTSAAPSDDDAGKPDINIPEAWAEIPDDWYEAVKGLKTEIGKKPKPVLKKTLEGMSERLEDEYMVTPEDVMQAWDSV